MTTKALTQNTTLTQTNAKSSALLSVLFVALLGGTMLFLAGHAQSQVLHDAAHDVRHATGFPCH
jgi:cobalt transporter subunit CbtB